MVSRVCEGISGGTQKPKALIELKLWVVDRQRSTTVVVPDACIKLLDEFTLALDQTGVLEGFKFSEGDEVAVDAVIAQLAIAEKEAKTWLHQSRQ